MAIVSREVHLLEVPTGAPRLDQFTLVERQLSTPLEHQIVVRNEFMSIDPAMRPRLSNGATQIGKPIAGATVGTVIQSRSSEFSPGDVVSHGMGFREYALGDSQNFTRLQLRGEPMQAHLGVLGVAGLTAYAGLFEVANLASGDRVFVSAAAGSVGSIAAQIAKLKGCYVIGSAGTVQKCAWLRDVAGLDAVINYKELPLRKSLKAAAPDGIDVYFDNVGGEHLNAALPRMRMWGRIAACGMISAYNNPSAVSEPVTTLSNIMYNRVRIQGFVVWDYDWLKPRFLAEMQEWLAEGKIKTEETILCGIESAPAALIGIMEGRNLGKMLVKLN